MTQLSPESENEAYCYLTTTGRKTGNPHEIEIWFAVSDTVPGILLLMAGARERSDWVRNLMQQPKVTLRIAGTTHEAIARVIKPTDSVDTEARRLLVAKYGTPQKPLTDWGRDALPVAITLSK